MWKPGSGGVEKRRIRRNKLIKKLNICVQPERGNSFAFNAQIKVSNQTHLWPEDICDGMEKSILFLCSRFESTQKDK